MDKPLHLIFNCNAMGMDIYLEDPAIKAKRKEYDKTFKKYVELRDKTKDKQQQARYQKKVDEWYGKMFCGNMGYFRVNYNDYSLSYWLMYNIDPKAKGDWGIEPFYSAVQGKKEPLIMDLNFHRKLLETARRWYDKASKLKGKESFLLVMDYKRSNLKKGKWVKKEVVLKSEQTDSYIEWLKELVDFAELAVKTGKPIYVSA